MYFPFFILYQRSKRSAIRPQTIYSEYPLFIRNPPAAEAVEGRCYASS